MRNGFLYATGLGFLTLAKAKHALQGYASPKPFSSADSERCIAYDLKVVDEWLSHFGAYAGPGARLEGQRVLELGPGSDLGVGLYLIARGAASYGACDVNDLMSRVPDAFYRDLIARIGTLPGTDTAPLDEELRLARSDRGSRLRLVVREDFDLVSAFGRDSIDLVFSQAAFEHFDDVERTVEQLTTVCRPGAMIVAEIDLKTHSRWIRDHDPNNIYRYSDSLYRALWFRGIPNRVRPYQYRRIFEAHGWTNVSVTPLERVAHPGQLGPVDAQFNDARNELELLSIVFCATKGPVKPAAAR
jgi:SAM-dependent methyltransferase